ncbi:ribosomal protein S2, flavodoxin-like domain-containing protein [Pilaira anomala]|nr:ribosomal protein S2, flavodoxin-like domain-containing protein [Pilaira anomala]
MSSYLDPTPEDIQLLLAAKCHLGTRNVNSQMKKYIYTRRADGTFLIHLGKLWEKLILAARVLATVTPKSSYDIYISSASVRGRRPANKLSNYLHATVNIGRFSPGTFTKLADEPQYLVCLDPYEDAQAINESSHCCIPVIAFTNSDSSLKFVDLAIPCNTAGAQSIGVMCYLLARAVLRLKGKIKYTVPWDVIPDMFFYTEEVDQIEEDAEEYSGDNQNDTSGGGTWNPDTIQFNQQDQGDVNWQNDNPKADWMMTEESTTFHMDQSFGDIPMHAAATVPPPPPPLVDWAEDEPYDASRVSATVTEEGWDAPATNTSTWQGSMKQPWD